MILTLLASFTGFISSIIPQVLKLWQQKQDNKQELDIIDRQLEQLKIKGNQRLEEVQIQADIAQTESIYKHDSSLQGNNWVESLRASVRPIITYSFFLLFAIVKISILYNSITIHSQPINIAIPLIWDENTQILFAAIVSFWFGNRTISKLH